MLGKRDVTGVTSRFFRYIPFSALWTDRSMSWLGTLQPVPTWVAKQKKGMPGIPFVTVRETELVVWQG